MEEALCDVMVFLRRGGREKRDGRKPGRGETDLSERARGEGTRRSGVSLCTGLSIFLLFLFLVLSFRHYYWQCVERFYGLFGVRVCP